jgi:hypothetical protein
MKSALFNQLARLSLRNAKNRQATEVLVQTLLALPWLANGRFMFEKRPQLFVRTHNEPLSVIAVCVSDEDYSPAGINVTSACLP